MRAIVPAVLIALLCHGAGLAVEVRGPWSDTLPEPVARRLAERSAPLRAEAGLQWDKSATRRKAPAALDAIVISCDFADSLLLGRHGQVPGNFPPPRQTDRSYAAHDSVFFAHKLQDVAAYFSDVSGGALELRFTVHARAVNLPQPMAWYGNHPTRGEQPILMAQAVIDSLDQEIDFTRYDTIVLVHAGAGEETDILGDSPEQIYSTYLNPPDFEAAFEDSVLAQPYLTAAGFEPGSGIDRVLVLPETEQQDPYGQFGGGFGSLGVYCFEFGLHLGMLSLSDFTPAGRPDSQGVGQYDLMGYGLFVGLGFIPPQPGPFNKVLMGWLDPYDADPDAGAVQALTPALDVGAPLACARIDISGQEYWLAEYRLQDPNGDRRFSFPGDLNGNGLPDFWDADSDSSDGTPTGLFDAATDTHEDLRGAEWDFAMSENAARLQGELGAGSGVYIWHIDEGVIAAAFGGPANLYNADPSHKAVDLEEADGIQDLDSNLPSAWQLGGDDDSFRGEGHASFGPDTRPDTRSNGGAPTGVIMRAFSEVVRDSAAYVVEVGLFTYPGYDYADTMTFRLERAEAVAGARLPAARRRLPDGVDLTGSHLLAVDLDGAGSQEIVVADRSGGVWAFTGDLLEHVDHDADPETIAPLASGQRGGQVADLAPARGCGRSRRRWPSRGRVDDRRRPLCLPRRRRAGSRSRGRCERALCRRARLFAGADTRTGGPAKRRSGDPAAAVGGRGRLRARGALRPVVLQWSGWAALEREIDLGSGHVVAAPQLFGSWLLVAVADTLAASRRAGAVRAARGDRSGGIAVAFGPGRGFGTAATGAWDVAAGGRTVPGSGSPATESLSHVLRRPMAGKTVVLDGGLRPVRDDVPLDARTGRVRAVVARRRRASRRAASDGSGRAATGSTGGRGGCAGGGDRPGVRAGGADRGCADGYDHYLFTAADGRLWARGSRGEDVPGWPLQGPAASAGTPVLGNFGGERRGPIWRRSDRRPASSAMRWRRASGHRCRFRARRLARRGRCWQNRWPMWGGSPWRSGDWDAAGFVGVPPVAVGGRAGAGQPLLLPESAGRRRAACPRPVARSRACAGDGA